MSFDTEPGTDEQGATFNNVPDFLHKEIEAVAGQTGEQKELPPNNINAQVIKQQTQDGIDVGAEWFAQNARK